MEGGPIGDAHSVSGQDVAHYVSVYVGQAEIATGIAIGKSFVVEAEQVQNGCVQIVNVNAVLHRFGAEFVGTPERQAAANTASGHPKGKGVGVMAATKSIGFAFAGGRSPELAG